MKYTLPNDTTKILSIAQLSIYGYRDPIFSCAHVFFGLGSKFDLKVLLSLSSLPPPPPPRYRSDRQPYSPFQKARRAAIRRWRDEGTVSKASAPFLFPFKSPLGIALRRRRPEG